MANMSYCRFQNTLQDLRDCKYVMEEAYTTNDMELSKEEHSAMIRLVNVCQEIIDNYERMEYMESEMEEDEEEVDDEEF